MKKCLLEEVVDFVPGINPTRLNQQFGVDDIVYYDQPSFDADYFVEKIDGTGIQQELEEKMLQTGDIVINNTVNLAARVQEGNAGKVLSLNFTKVMIQADKIDPDYFVYVYNSYSEMKKQKNRELQGSGPLVKIPISAMRKLDIPLPSLEKQRVIGQTYQKTQQLKQQLRYYATLMDSYVEGTIEKVMKER